MKNQYSAKVFVASDHIKQERKFWNAMIVVSAIAVVVCAFMVAAYFDSESLQTAIQMGAR